MLELSLLLPPLIAGAIVLSTHVPLGREVLKRGIIFIDLAVAQLAGLGVILAHLIIDNPENTLVQMAALIAALIGALGFRLAEKRWSDVLEAIIGVVFVLSISAAILLLANDPHGSERLQDLLAGQLLWVTYDDLLLPGLLSIIILIFWFTGTSSNRHLAFYMLFALSITMSVQLVGVYLVFASLIIPALASRKSSLSLAYFVGLMGYILGLVVSVWSDLPTGPLIVWAMAIVGLFVATSSLKGKYA